MATTKISDTYEPELADRVRMLEQKRDSLRSEGYAAMVDYEVLRAQDLKDSDNVAVQAGRDQRIMKRGDYMLDLQRKVKNCYAAARRMQEMLDALPQEKPDLRVEEAD